MQELGNVIGPVYGAAVLALGSWRSIFWINLGVAVVLAVVLRVGAPGWAGPSGVPPDATGPAPCWWRCSPGSCCWC
ncbi:MAG: hypothetical protein R2734_17360 [Nocardioides sp.]